MDRLTRFLNTLSSRSTIQGYKSSIKHFLQLLYKKGSLEEQAERYFKEKRNYQEDLTAFLAGLKGKAPKTVSFELTGVKSFLLENGVELPESFWRRLRGRRKGTRALTIDKVPSNAELRRILAHMPIQGRALYLVLASSGMRIGEALQLTFSDLELNQDPPRVRLQGAYKKAENSRIAFLSQEAKEQLEEWFKVRPQYLKTAMAKTSFGIKKSDDQRVFPFLLPTAHSLWINAISKAGFKEKNNGTYRLTVHPRVLRRFYRTRLGAVIPVDVVEALMGHESYLAEVYRRYTLEDSAKFYKQGEHALLLHTDGEQVSRLKEDIQKEKSYIESFVTEALRKKDLEIQELRTDNSRMKLEIAEIRKILEAAGSVKLLRRSAP